MKQRAKASPKQTMAREALRRRVIGWYNRFNGQRWSDCYRLVDPRLVNAGKVEEGAYTRSLQSFHDRYGSIRPWHVRISLHLRASGQASDSRPFAYVYTVWQDERHDFHLFRERWVRDGKSWFTRVAGLVVNEPVIKQAG